MKGKLAVCGFAIMALLLGASSALAAEPTLPHAFYGTVAIGESDAPVGSVVSAEVGGANCGSYTIKVAGHYGNLDERDYLIVQGDISNGDSVTFYVNGVSTDQTVAFEAGGGPTQLDLTVPETAPTVVTNAATSVTTNSATLNGNLGSLGTALSATVSFEWGTTTAYGRETATQTMTSTGSFSFSLSGLSDDTTYHFRAKAVGHGTSYGVDRSFATREVTVGMSLPAPPPSGTTDVRGVVTTAGRFTRSVTATSEDELCTLTIPRGTVGLTEELEPLDEITMVMKDEPPPPPEDVHIVGLAYDLGPDGATFDTPITLEYTYDLGDIPEGVAEEDLVIAYYDEEAGKWVELPSTVDPETNTITASVSHFTTFAIIARRPVPPPPPPAPAAFSVSSLTIQPAEVQPQEAVTITVSVANTGGTEGSYSVVLMINGAKEAEKRVTVAAGESQLVSFSLAKEEAGSYSVVVDGLRASFTVVAPPVPAPPPPPVPAPVPPVKPPFNWPLVGGIIGGAVVVGLLIFFLVVRRRAY